MCDILLRTTTLPRGVEQSLFIEAIRFDHQPAVTYAGPSSDGYAVIINAIPAAPFPPSFVRSFTRFEQRRPVE